MPHPEGSPKMSRHEMLALFPEMSFERIKRRAQLGTINVCSHSLTELLIPAELHFSSFIVPQLPKRENKAKATPTKGQNATIEADKRCSVKWVEKRSNGSPLSTI